VKKSRPIVTALVEDTEDEGSTLHDQSEGDDEELKE
jgi:hypothetical protein